MPTRDATAHSQELVAHLDAVFRNSYHEPGSRDIAANREVILLHVEPGIQITPDSFGDRRNDIRVVSHDVERHTVLLDAANPYLPHLRRKIEVYAADRSQASGGGTRRNERAIAPLVRAEPGSTLEVVAGPLLREDIQTGRVTDTDFRALELTCRGGYREASRVVDATRGQLRRVLEALDGAPFQEFQTPEYLIAFVYLRIEQVRRLIAMTDCVFDVELPSSAIRDLLISELAEARDLRSFRLGRPAETAPSVVVLDTGISTQHPLLAAAIRHASSVVPEDDSPEDHQGHGTQMAGVGLYESLGERIEGGRSDAVHWVESVKLLRDEGVGSAAEEARQFWPKLTSDAVMRAALDDPDRRRVYVLAVTGALKTPPKATSWSQAVDQLAHNYGMGRLLCVSLGNTDANTRRIIDNYPLSNLDEPLLDPAQAANALTVGAYAARAIVSPLTPNGACVAPEGGISPWTRAGVRQHAIKPDVVFDGGNVVLDGNMIYSDQATTTTLTTRHEYLRHPLGTIWGTSAATAHAGRFAARLWAAHPEYRPETIRALVAHSADWTPEMVVQFRNVDDRLSACGYGVPDFEYASQCTRTRATVIIEDAMPNSVFVRLQEDPETIKQERRIKFFELPIPEALGSDEEAVELRITLSYFAEPSAVGRQERRGLDLAFAVQGVAETADQFRARMNKLQRMRRNAAAPPTEVAAQDADATTLEEEMAVRGQEDAARGGEVAATAQAATGFTREWAIGKQRRGRGTLQHDRLRVPASYLAGPRLIAVAPVLGWWEGRKDTIDAEMPFSLIVTLETAERDVYTPIHAALEAVVEAKTDAVVVEVISG